MAVEKWTAATDRGTVLDTQLNALGIGAQSAVGSATIANQTNLDRFFVGELKVTFGTNPTEGETVELYAVPDGGGGEETRPNNHLCGVFKVEANTGAQILYTEPFNLGPHVYKFSALNRAGFAFPASGSTIKVHSFNRQN